MGLKQVKILRWQPPPYSFVKLNCDGCSRDNPGEVAMGGIIRSNKGEFIWAYGSFLGNQTKMVAELEALYEGLKYCAANGLHDVIVNSDSMSLVQCVNSKTSPLWMYHGKFREIIHILQDCNMKVLHCFREINVVADYLVNYACNEREHFNWHSPRLLPEFARGLINLDKLQMPYIRNLC
ncbi:Ribonuclease H protein [Quillaja saponaria]|uniref:Ribonuclease H protein n=1 Tax=Quillaja saponaria TaxID=32244 RepID=A0AAD7VDB8_QUISA|nr:Ribonuclease H protein [Quillaja saponaria]